MRTSIRHNTIARNRRLLGSAVLAALALGAISISSLAVSAQTGHSVSQEQTAIQPRLAAAPVLHSQLRPTLASTQEAQPRRQVRIIPLFNTPADQTLIQPR